MNHNIPSNIMPTYGDRTLEFVKGAGCYLTDNNKKRYLDFGSGIAVTSLGHCHPKLIKALNRQSKKLWHTSNLYYNSNQEKYANILCKNSFADKVFFTNSGTEAIEAGIKVIRSYHFHHNNYEKKNIITFDGSFHGRTMAALSAQKNLKNSEKFKPLLSGFIKTQFNDFGKLARIVNEKTSAIMIEPVQGEGGVRPANLKFLDKVRNLCDKRKILYFLDEVQCGFGRSGKLFSYEWANFEPDILALAKGIGSGFPLGACLSTEEACIGMTKGSHGSTYGGNPLAISVGMAVSNEVLKKNFLINVDKISRYLWNELKKLENKFEEILDIRGAGLILGIKAKKNNLELCELLKNNGLLTIPASDNILRLVPPLILKKKQVDESISIINKTFSEL